MCLQCYQSDDSRQSSANKRISDSIPNMKSFVYKENNSGTPDKTGAKSDQETKCGICFIEVGPQT